MRLITQFFERNAARRRQREERLSTIRQMFSDRVAVADGEFVQRCGVAVNHFSISLAKLIRERLAQVGSIPADRLLPEDSLGPPMSYICRWPGFEATLPLLDFERQFNVSASPERLERIPDPTSRRGSVGDQFINLHRAYSENQGEPGRR